MLFDKRLIVVAALGIAACGDVDSTDPEGPLPPPEEGSESEFGLRWGSADDPSIFTPDLRLVLAELPREGQAAQVPWASSYWPTHEDSINYRWDGDTSDSPAAKYGKAFGVADAENKVSQYYGIAKYGSRTECSDDTVCKKELGETCAKRRGAEKGRCIPTWWGICHAWTPASILQPEAVKPVTKNGVTFKVNDIKALVTLAYDKSTSKFVSLRCDEDDGQNKIEYDEYGRPKGADVQCLDTNPGTYHLILANYLGIKQVSFAEDRTFDDEVWNQPMRSFKVLELREVAFKEANALVGVKPTGGTETKASGDVAQGAWQHQAAVAVTAGTKLRVEITGTGDADLYVRFGVQATSSSYDCRPYDNGSAEVCELTVPPATTQAFVSVYGYSAAKYDLTVVAGGDLPANYLFNADAKKIFYVKTRTTYIGESSSSTDGNLSDSIDRYSHDDTYEYLLELDDAGKIIGGEWLNGSKKAHPDFLWLPTGRQNLAIAGGALKWENIKQLLDESLAGTTTDSTVSVKESGTVVRDAWKHYGPFEATSGSFVAKLTGDGDADLYVRKGAAPTLTAYDCRPYAGGSAEDCTVAGPGIFYASVQGYAASSNFQLEVTFKGTSPNQPPPPPPTHLNLSGTVALGQSINYTVPVSAGRAIVVRLSGPNDIDLYLRAGTAPTTTSYERASESPTGTEEIRYVPANDGTLHVLVYGYAASSFTLTTADN